MHCFVSNLICTMGGFHKHGLDVSKWTGITTRSATSGQHKKRSIFPPWVDIDQYYFIAFTKCFPSVLAHCRQAKRTHRPSHTCILIITVWVHCTCSAYQSACFECTNAVWYTVISRSTQNHTVIQYTGLGEVSFILTMQCRNGPLLVVL